MLIIGPTNVCSLGVAFAIMKFLSAILLSIPRYGPYFLPSVSSTYSTLLITYDYHYFGSFTVSNSMCCSIKWHCTNLQRSPSISHLQTSRHCWQTSHFYVVQIPQQSCRACLDSPEKPDHAITSGFLLYFVLIPIPSAPSSVCWLMPANAFGSWGQWW